MSRLNETNVKVEKRRSFVKTSDKLNFGKKNALYMLDKKTNNYWARLERGQNVEPYSMEYPTRSAKWSTLKIIY